MARRLDGDFGEGVVFDTFEDGSYLVMWNEEEIAAKLTASDVMPFGSGMGLSTERRQRVAPAFILNNFLMKTAVPSNDLSRVQMVVRDGADVNCTDSDGNSPLNLAVSTGASVVLVQFLISRGAHVNFVGPAGSALQIAAIQDNVEAVRCLLSHGADPGLVDLEASAEESAQLLRESLIESEASPNASQVPLTSEERAKHADECFTHLLPSLVGCLSSTQSPKLHKRCLMLLSYVVQRASASQLVLLTPLQLGAFLSTLRGLLASDATLEQIIGLRMLCSGLTAWPALASAARRHGVDHLLRQLSHRCTTDSENEGAVTGVAASRNSQSGMAVPAVPTTQSRAHMYNNMCTIKLSDIKKATDTAIGLLTEVPSTPAESIALRSLQALPLEGQRAFGRAAAKLANLLLGEQAPSAHELQQSGCVSWLLAELSSSRPVELRQRWSDFEMAFGSRPGSPGGEALEQLVALLHDVLCACDGLPVHTYASAGDGLHSLKPLSEAIHVCLHPHLSAAGNPISKLAVAGSTVPLCQGASTEGSGSGTRTRGDSGDGDAATLRPAFSTSSFSLSFDPLVRIAQLQQHLLRTSAVSDTAYEAYCSRLLGAIIEERPMIVEHGAVETNSHGSSGSSYPWCASHQPFRRATVTGLRIATPLRLLLHTLVFDDLREVEVVIATRQYRIIGKVTREVLERKRSATRDHSSLIEVADPEARIHTVTIACPEGLPVDLFLENVLSTVRRALRQAEPGVAPMSRAPSDEYGWRDRGWERGGAQFERTVAEKLRDTGEAAVARRQTMAEAETLVNRLQGTMMVNIEVEKLQQQADAREAAERFPVLSRVQGLVASTDGSFAVGVGGDRASNGERWSNNDDSSGAAHWLAATVVDAGGGGVSLVYDDGVFEPAMPGYRVRTVPHPEAKHRLNPLAAIFMSFEQFLSSREERRAEYELAARDAQPANLRRSLSAFHVGRAQQVGRVPREAIDDKHDKSGDGQGCGAMDTSPVGDELRESDEPFDIAPMRLQVRFALGTASEMPAAEDGMTFDGELTLLHCLQALRESTASGRAAALEPQELGYHPGVTCDRTGQNPILGDRYKLNDENYDVCEAEYSKMSPAEQAQYTRIPPPAYRKPKGCGPAKWHLYFWMQVADVSVPSKRITGSTSSAGAAGSVTSSVPATCPTDEAACRSPHSAAVGASGTQQCVGSRGSPSGSPPSGLAGSSGVLAFTAKEVEAGLLSGRLEPEVVLRELRRVLPGSELRLSDAATRVLAGSYGTALAPLCSAQLMNIFREVSGTPHAAVSASPPIPSPAAVAELRAELSTAGVPRGDFTDVTLLLWLLSRRILSDAKAPSVTECSPAAERVRIDAVANAAQHSESPVGAFAGERPETRARRLLVSSLLSAKLQRQLSDALAVSSGALPQWCRLLLKRCPALFSPGARSMFFRSSAFGISRAVHWSQEAQVACLRSAYAEELAALERARLEAELGNDPQGLAEVVEQQTEIEDRIGRERLGALRSDIARVSRERLLPMAEKLMALHAPSKHALEIQFEGESGFGSGVTQNFYSATANELLKAGVNKKLPVWICDFSNVQSSDGVIVHAGEIFPLPLPPSTPPSRHAAVCERFRFLGRLMGKACRDSFIVPLPLSRHFFRLVRGETLTYAALPPAGTTGGVAAGYAKVCSRLAAIDAEGSALGEAERRRRYEREADREFASSCLGLGTRLSLREWLQAGACGFVCPLTDEPLCEGGEERELTVHNLQEYVHLLAQLWLADGVLLQAAAFREGVEEVFALERLSLFPLFELQTVLCGTMLIEWSEVELQRHLHPTGGYTKHSKIYQLLIDELQRMGNEARAKFLNFVTACPHLPPVGLSMLEIEILPPPKGGTFPTAQTCGNKLYLPEYETAEELRSGLAEAFANTEAGGLHEHAG